MDKGNDTPETAISASMPERLGGRLCLDFVNTVDPRHSDQPYEYLTSYADLVAWGRYVDVLTEDEAQHFLARATQHPAVALVIFQRALSLREGLYQLFTAVREGRSPDEEDMEVLNVALSEGMAQARLLSQGKSFVWTWDTTPRTLDRVLWSVARSAAELLTSEDLSLVKECPGEDGCGWLFLDTSRNHRRRWCTMEGCGNRAKARRHYERRSER